MKVAALGFVVLLLGACGYHPLHGGSARTERYAVVLVSSTVPDASASDEVVAGVREELARLGALASGDGYPRCEVEVLRADESSEGIGAARNESNVLQPKARATQVGILARAVLVRAKGAAPERDTGDVRATDVVAVAPDAREALFRHLDTLRAAGRRVGHKLAQRMVGLPSSSE